MARGDVGGVGLDESMTSNAVGAASADGSSSYAPSPEAPSPEALSPEPPVAIDSNAVVIDDTSELRWFFDGPLPPDVLRWFTRGGTVGLRQDRCDSYRVDAAVGTGVKRRFGSKLELKLRLGEPRPCAIARGCAGMLESWRRWSPADDLVAVDDDMRWEDVDKSIVKRRFDVAGAEVRLTEATRAMDGSGCDAEIVAVRIDGRSAWGFALAAFGAPGDHVEFLRAAWNGLVADGAPPAPLRCSTAVSVGYPEWLTCVGAARRASSAAADALAGR